jgi:hypothetical protein
MKSADREKKKEQQAAARASAAKTRAWNPYGDSHKALLDIVEEKLPLGSGKSKAWADVAAELTTVMEEKHGKSCLYEGSSCYDKFVGLVNKVEPTGNDDGHLIPRAKKIEQLIITKSGARSAAFDGISALESTGIPSVQPASAIKASIGAKRSADSAKGGKPKKPRFGKTDLPVSRTRCASPLTHWR